MSLQVYFARLVFSCMLIGPAHFALGQADQWTSIPLPKSSKDISGFTAQIDLIHPESEGYMPLRFTARSSVGTFPGDRLIELQVVPSSQNFPPPETSYTIRMTLPADTSFFEKTYYLPKWFWGSGLRFSIRDRDGPLTGYVAESSKPLPSLHQFQYMPADVKPRLAILIPEPGNQDPAPALRIPDLRSWDCLHHPNAGFMNARSVRRHDDDEALNYLQTASPTATQILRPSTAYEHWLGYESVDIVLSSYTLLQQLRSERPERFEALRQWISTGGVLWTFGIPAPETLAEFFDVNPPREIPSEEVTAIDRALSKLAAVDSFYPSTTTLLSYQQSMGEMSAEEANVAFSSRNFILQQMEQANHPFAAQTTKEQLSNLFVPLAVEAGTVIGIRSEDPFPGSYGEWYTIQHLSGANQFMRLRRGASLARGSTHFWEWLLLNVSRPPVYGFLTLLTFFVILVGPVSYQLLRRMGRTYLMFLIAPLLALATTTMLFVYGFLADGFRTQTRIRQITWVDGTSGRGSTMTRATYYAPFKSAAGLSYPEDVAVYPVDDEDVALSRFADNNNRIRQQWTTDSSTQRFTGDILPSRTQRQFFSYQPTSNFEGIEVVLDGQTLNLENSTNTQINEFIYRSDTEELYQLSTTCPPGVKVALEKIDFSQAGRKLRQLYIASQPELPLGYVRPDQNTMAPTFYGGRIPAGEIVDLNQASWAIPNDNWGIYEARLRTMLLDQATLPVGWFVAASSVAPEESGSQGATVVDSIRFIMGTLP